MMKRYRAIALIVAVVLLAGALAVAANGDSGKPDLTGLHVGVLILGTYEPDEALLPLSYFRDRGATVTVIGEKLGPATPWVYSPVIDSTLYYGVKAPEGFGADTPRVTVDCLVKDYDAEDLDCLIIPLRLREGERMAHTKLSELAASDNEATALVRRAIVAGIPVGASNYGLVAVAAADALAGKTATGNSLLLDGILRNTGATFRDAGVVVDGTLVTARGPADMPTYLAALARQLEKRTGR